MSWHELLKAKESEYAGLIDFLYKGNESEAFVVPTITTPFIDINYQSLKTVSNELQSHVAVVKRKIVSINEKFKNMEFWDRKTFDFENSDANYEKATLNSSDSAKSTLGELQIAINHLNNIEEALTADKIFFGNS